jgi:tetratricopeptide (TPR) repeat protein
MFGRTVISRLACTSAILLGPLGGLSVATAQTAQDISWCNGKDGASAEQRIRGCTTLIQSGKLSGEKLGLAFRLRGNAYLYGKSDHTADDIDAAIRDYTEAIRLRPTDAAAFYARADALRTKAYWGPESERKKLETSAISDFTQAIQLRPVPDPMYFINRSNAYIAVEDYDHALSDLGEALRVDPADKDQALLNRCHLYGRLGKWPEAFADCERSLTLKNMEGQDADREANTLATRGFVYLRMGRYKDAIADYGKVLADPHTGAWFRASALFGRGYAQNKLGDVGKGQADMAAALKLMPKVARSFADGGVK